MTTRKGGPAQVTESEPPTTPKHQPGNDTKTVYPYPDEHGNPLFRVIRRPGKKFHQERYQDGKWVKGLDDTRRVLYNLPQVRETAARGGTVFVVEGERDANNVNALGAVATCNPMGAGRNKWRDEFSKSLVGVKRANIVWDNDDEGRQHALNIAASLKSVGVPVQFFRAKEGKDVSDHLAAGLKLYDLVKEDPGPPVPLTSPVAAYTLSDGPGGAPDPAVYQLALIRLGEHAKQHGLREPRKADDGEWECCCPAHDDHRASLGIRMGDHRALVAFCQAGCSHEEIANALGIDHREFSVSSKSRRSVRRSTGASPPRKATLAFAASGSSPTLGAMLRSARRQTR
jgi:hypothetical protein